MLVRAGRDAVLRVVLVVALATVPQMATGRRCTHLQRHLGPADGLAPEGTEVRQSGPVQIEVAELVVN